MHHIKKLVFFIFFISLSFSGDRHFRGMNKNEVLRSKIPISFRHQVMQGYDVLPQQLSVNRGSYLIIAREGLVQQGYVEVFAEFKKTQGFDVYIVSLSDSELDVNSVQNHITEHFTADPMLEYVLLIGDVDGFAEIPSYYYGPENDVTDQKYTHILGDDYIPDLFIGRISIDSAYELAVIMLKTIAYAREPLAYDQNWLDRALVVAGNYANSPPIPITPKWTSSWLRDELLNLGYNSVDTVFYPPIQQGAPYITEIINNGVGLVNYRGWGDANGWHYPEFHADDVNGLNNGWLTPVFMSYVCNSNDFANSVDPCFAEAILRGGTTSNPKGGVAFIGPSDLHTSTKYNNVINASMYDAMINYDVLELGPALMAGQFGLVKEFPNQDEPGEAQEFYFHVYNILGDPSLQVYLDTPDTFIIEADEVSSKDGYLSVKVTSSDGIPVKETVISVIKDGQILSKGITSDSGYYIDNINIDNQGNIDIYANKAGFIQGHISKSINNENSSGLRIKKIYSSNELESGINSFGSVIDLNIQFLNSSSNTFESSDAVINFSQGLTPSSSSFSLPRISSGDSAIVSVSSLQIHGSGSEYYIDGTILNQNGDELFNIGLKIEPVNILASIVNQDVSLLSEFSPQIEINNYSASKYEDVKIILQTLSEGSEIINNGNVSLSHNVEPFSSEVFQTNYSVNVGNISSGSTVTILLQLKKLDSTFFSQKLEFEIASEFQNFPVSPNDYGYWAYDNTDTEYEQKPSFDWIELDPSFGGDGATEYLLDDDDHVDVQLPFQVKYHGEYFNELTINSNGWASLVPCDIDYFWNMSIPSFMSPKAMLAPFWDDLEVVGEDWIRVYTKHDALQGKFIIEWSRALNGYDELTKETFEIIIYDTNSISTASGDNVIEFQYLEIDDVDVTKNYSTVGIQSPQNNDGLSVVFNNNYTPGATSLVDSTIIRFTTDAPDSYISPLGVDEKVLIPENFTIGKLYPNPFNPRVNIDLKVVENGKVTISVFDMRGRVVDEIHSGVLVSGNHHFSWDGKTYNNQLASSGAYFLVVSNGINKQFKKMLLLK